MPKDLGTILNHAFTVAGVKADNNDLKAILTNPELSKVQVPDELVTAIETNLMSEASATAKVGAKLKAEALNGANVHIKRLAEQDFKDDATFLAELEAEKNPGKQAEMLAKKVREVEAARAKAPEADKAELLKQINELKAAKAQIETAKAQELDSIRSQHDSELTNMIIRQQLAQVKRPSAYKDLSDDLWVAMVETALKNEMSASKVKVVRKDGSLTLVQEDGSDYFDKNVKVDFKGFVDATTSKHKLVATADDPGNGGDPNPKVIVGGGGQGKGNPALIASIDAQLAELNAASNS